MSISSISGIGRISSSNADTAAADAPVRQGKAPIDAQSDAEIDQITKQPLPPRFPWLSRLSQQLEAAAKQRPAFPAAPVLGDHLDRSA